MQRAARDGQRFDTIFLDLPSAEQRAGARDRARELVRLDPDADVVLCADCTQVDPDRMLDDGATAERTILLQRPFHRARSASWRARARRQARRAEPRRGGSPTSIR